jgi:hypothetical protein
VVKTSDVRGQNNNKAFCEAVTLLFSVNGTVLLVVGVSSEMLVHGTGISSKQLAMLG